MGGDALDGEDVADAAVADDLLGHEHVGCHHVDGDAGEADVVAACGLDLEGEVVDGGGGRLLGDEVLAGVEDGHVDVVVGGDGGGVDGDVEVAVRDEVLDGVEGAWDVEALAGGVGSFGDDVAGGGADGVCGLGDVGEVLAVGEGAAADDGDFPGGGAHGGRFRLRVWVGVWEGVRFSV